MSNSRVLAVALFDAVANAGKDNFDATEAQVDDHGMDPEIKKAMREMYALGYARGALKVMLTGNYK